MKTRKRTEFGEYLVADPEICGGEWTFKGTRLFVKDALEMLARGYEWEQISYAFDGRVSQPALAEAVALALQALQKNTDKLRRAA